MKIQSTTIYRLPITNYHCASGTTSTLVESALQISPFLTNKANFPKSQMNVSDFIKRDYEQMDTWSSGKNKANSNPMQTQFKANTKPIQTQYKPKQSQFQGSEMQEFSSMKREKGLQAMLIAPRITFPTRKIIGLDSWTVLKYYLHMKENREELR